MSMTMISGSVQSVWVPIKASTTMYVGGLCTVDISAPDEGFEMLPVAAGVANATNNDVPYGIVIGTNNKTPLYSATHLCEYITAPGATDAHDGSASTYVGVEGPWAKGDQVAMVEVDLITPMSVIRAPIRASSKLENIAVVTCTTGDSSGKGGTFSPVIDFTPADEGLNTVYFRSGANAGAYRVMSGTSTSSLAWTKSLRNDVAVGDTAVAVPIRPNGPSSVYFHATQMGWIDVDVEMNKNMSALWMVNVVRLDLSVAGGEYCDFMFQGCHLTNATTQNAP